MNTQSWSTATAEAEEIAQLRERVRALETRLDRLERAGAADLAPEPERGSAISAKVPAIDTEIAAATVFKRIAMLCFVLLGALILRVLTQQNILGPRFGTVLGFGYAGHLIVLSLIPGRFGRFAGENTVFQCSGAILAFFIALECSLRTQTMGRISAMLAIVAFALLAFGMGIHQRKGSLAGIGIIGGMLALVALDLKGTGVALQLALLLLVAAPSIVFSWREGWAWLRPTTMIMLLLLLPLGFFFCGNEPGVASGLLGTSTGLWCAAVLQHLAVFRRLHRASVWLPIATVWFALIQHLAGWPFVGITNGGISVFALGSLIVCSRYAAGATPGITGLIATAAFAGAVGWGLLDRTGFLCAAVGMLLWFAGSRAASDWAAAYATMLMLSSAALGLAQLLGPAVGAAGLSAMALSALVLGIHYWRNSRTGPGPYAGWAMRLAPVALVAALLLLLGLFWELLQRVFPQPAQLLLGQTVVVVFTALTLTFSGHVAQRRSMLFCGLGCMALVLAKVLFVDLMTLKSFNMLASVVLVALACVAVSLILRRRA